MSTQSLTFLKATRIVESQDRVKAEEAYLEGAQERLAEAEQKATAATGSDKEQANAEVKAQKLEVANSQARLTYERENLERLLDLQSQGHVGWMAYVVFGLMGAFVLVMIFAGMWNGTLLASLKVTDVSRGLITFLITVVTVTIALILTLSTIVSASPDRSERFKDGKDLLFALIGVLGTIVGFYFGQQASDAPLLQVAPVFVSNENPAEGDTVSLISFVTGGKAPYIYDIVFDPDEPLESITAQESANGLLVEEVEVQGVSKVTEVKFSINVRDSHGATIVSESKTMTLTPR